METILVTGASRGIGLEWVRQCARRGWRVYATCREPLEASALERVAAEYAGLTVHKLDVTSPASVASLARELRDTAIDLLVLNAGIFPDFSGCLPVGRIDYDAWEETLRVNVLGAARVTEALVENLAISRRRLVVGISSEMGSIGRLQSQGCFAYRSSKAALNITMRGMALELEPRGIGVLLLHPGWVRSGLGGPSATLDAGESVRHMLDRVLQFRMQQSGLLFRYDGQSIPW